MSKIFPTTSTHSRGAAAFWGPSVVFDVVVFALIVYKSSVTIKHNRSLGMLGILLRDGKSLIVGDRHFLICIDRLGSLYFTLVNFKGVLCNLDLIYL
jgi:hypothetical protein